MSWGPGVETGVGAGQGFPGSFLLRRHGAGHGNVQFKIQVARFPPRYSLALEAQHGAEGRFIRRIDSPDGMVVVKRPAHVAYKQFVDNGKFTLDACNKLVLCCLVYPSKEAYTDLTDKSPAVVTAAANEIVKLAGFKAEDNSGK